MIPREAILHQQVCDYLRLRYPDVLFRTDLGGVRLTMGQAAKVKRLQGGRRAWPDLFIAEPRHKVYGGLFIELKATKITKRDGKTLLSSKHLQEQSKLLNALNDRGYFARFAVGFDAAREIIDWYLK